MSKKYVPKLYFDFNTTNEKSAPIPDVYDVRESDGKYFINDDWILITKPGNEYFSIDDWKFYSKAEFENKASYDKSNQNPFNIKRTKQAALGITTTIYTRFKYGLQSEPKQENTCVSPNEEYIITYQNKRLDISKYKIGQAFKKDSVCFLVPENANLNYSEIDNWFNNNIYVETNILYTRYHPITGKAIGSESRLKGKIRVIGRQGNEFYGVVTELPRGENINEGDYVAGMHSSGYGNIPGNVFRYTSTLSLKCQSKISDKSGFNERDKSEQLKTDSDENKSVSTGNKNSNIDKPKPILISIQREDTLWCTEFNTLITDELGLESEIKNGITTLFSDFGNFKSYLLTSNSPRFKKISITLFLKFSYNSSMKQGKVEYFANCDYTFKLVNIESGLTIKEYSKKLTNMDFASAFLRGASSQKDALGNLLSGKVKKELKKSAEYLYFK